MADDDALMDRFEKNSRRFNARDGIITVFLAAFVLVLIQGNGLKSQGERLKPGVQRTVVLGVAKPAGWLADLLPLHTVAHKLTAGLSPDTELAKTGGFNSTPTAAAGGVPVVTPDAFTAASLGAKPAAKVQLKKLLVTGDSLSQIPSASIGRLLEPKGVKVIPDFHLGTGISKTDILDWGREAVTQTQNDAPDAVVMFMGANEGFPMKGPSGKDVNCCSAAWASIYANRARGMMNTYRRGGRTHIYWLTIPAQREASRQTIARVVNAAIRVAAQPWGDQVTVVDTNPTFTPGGKYRDAMVVDGDKKIVRQADGIHLNQTGSDLLAKILAQQFQSRFTF